MVLEDNFQGEPIRQTKDYSFNSSLTDSFKKQVKCPTPKNLPTLNDNPKPFNVNKFVTPDQVLAIYGSRNLYLLTIWTMMGVVWGLSAMPMMVSAFLTSHSCNVSANCTLIDGSMAKEFDLTGKRATLADYASSGFLIGVLFGNILLPQLSDKKGRRTILILSMFFLGLFGTLSAFAFDIFSFTVLRFLQGIFFTGCGITNWILAYESIPLKLRSYTTLVFGLFWVIGYTIVAPLAYFFSNWRHLMISVSAPTIFFAIFFYFTVPESFHYLVTQKRKLSLAKWIERANYFADWNNSPKALIVAKLLFHNNPPQSEINELNLPEDGRSLTSKNNFFCQLINNRSLLIYTLVLTYLWTCDNIVYYGLSLFSTRLAGNPYVNFTLVGLIEIPSYLFSPYLLNKLGRRFFVSLCHFLATTSFVIVLLTHNQQIYLTMWLVGKFAISCAFTSLFVYSSELFPTSVRNSCIGVCSVVARLGGSFAPTIQHMAIITPKLPTIFFAVCAGIGGALTLILPETLHCELPD